MTQHPCLCDICLAARDAEIARVRAEKVEKVTLPPAPWTFSPSGAPGGNGHYNLYVSDATGRKIFSIYGKRGEQELLAEAICRLPELLVGRGER